MARVFLQAEQRRFTGGVDEVEVDAANVAGLIRELEARYPGIGATLEESAVAINGVLLTDAAFEPVPAGAEVHFVFAPQGG